jgi:uncharacterized Zn finger protein
MASQSKKRLGGSSRPATTIKDVEAYLAQQDKPMLVSLLMEQVKADGRLRERLLMQVARTRASGPDLAVFRQALESALSTDFTRHGYVEYGDMWDYAEGIHEVISSYAELLKEGYPVEVIELTEDALEQVEEATHAVDDSSGEMGSILHELKALHQAACKKAKPDPERLAMWLFEKELASDYGIFDGAAEEYATVLGKKGLAKHRELIEAEWARTPALAPGADDPHRSGRRYRLTRMMEAIARKSNDLEALVAVKSRDLSSAYRFLEIAEIYKQARKYDRALAWAERGLKAFPQRTDRRLREFLAEEYHRCKRHDEAMALIWAELTESSGHYLQSYEALKRHADRTGEWPQWRERALDFIRERLRPAPQQAAKYHWQWASHAGHSELVRIFLWEEDAEAAWQEAQAGGCSDDLWLQLAARREKDHPADALEIYQRQIEPLVNQKNNQAYEQAAKYVRKVRELMKRLGREAEFAMYLAGLRKAHKPKRNFRALLDRMK